jgi:hypothetical protein
LDTLLDAHVHQNDRVKKMVKITRFDLLGMAYRQRARKDPEMTRFVPGTK